MLLLNEERGSGVLTRQNVFSLSLEVLSSALMTSLVYFSLECAIVKKKYSELPAGKEILLQLQPELLLSSRSWKNRDLGLINNALEWKLHKHEVPKFSRVPDEWKGLILFKCR